MKDCYPVTPPCPPPVCKPWPSIFIEAIIVCVDYADFLAWTLPFNRGQFDGCVVVTTPQDTATQDICSHYHIRCVVTDVCHNGGKAFDKAAMINAGLRECSRRDWIVQLDADILLPPRAKELIERSQPRRDFVYGLDRVDVPSF